MPRGMQKKQKEEKKDDGRNEKGRPVRQPVSQIRKYIHSDCTTDQAVREGVFAMILDTVWKVFPDGNDDNAE